MTPAKPNASESKPQCVDSSESGTRVPRRKTVQQHPVKKLLKILGPGLITGASDDDPSGIGTYAMAGAALGYSALWLAAVTFPVLTAGQVICAHVRLVA